ncbi:SAC3/GANP/Nin1/mts3/eIF-3 p25 family-domain-containing protein [Ochromonadaceae sp. CCMP2298]|nr:SAC3/GANP/Nin1/mts3/eIF-3 p25 family-domain-containing protein [Ochromonadaceae sp. CCMP2298]
MTQRVKKVKKVVKQNSSGDFDPDSLKIVGICQKLEKEYLRLTQAPLPSVVRPEQVLRKTVQLIKKKWAEGVVDYVYMCSQLKSMRQDLTVQHIQNDFTVHVYETHARVALESDDMNEYNQCQTQLKHLYASGLKGSEMEFTAYRVLYYVYLRGNKKYTAGSSDLAHLMSTLKPEAMSDPAVAHALKIRQALQADNYHSFFQLYLKTPNMGTYILDLMVENLRATTLVKICKVYKPSVEADFVLKELAFTDKHIGLEFMQKVGCKIEKDRERWVWNTKDSVVDVSALVTETKLLL